MKKSLNILFIICIIAIIISLITTRKQTPKAVIEIDTIIQCDTVYDTITLYKEKPVPVQVFLTDTVEIMTVDSVFVHVKEETKIYNDTLIWENDTALYQASISGVNARLDWIRLQYLKREVINTSTITIKEQHKKLHLSPTVGVGYGVFNKKPDLFIGLSIAL